MDTSQVTTPPSEHMAEQIADHSDSEVGHYGDVDQVVDMSRILMSGSGMYQK